MSPRAATTTDPNVPQNIVDAINLVGLRYTFVAAFPIDDLESDARIQVRDDNHVAPREQVERYAAAMAAGATFAPIVATRDKKKVDGNTRAGAAQKNKRHDLPAVVLDIDVDGADHNQVAKLRVLAGVLNQHNGLPLTRIELRKEVESALDLGWTNDTIAEHLSVPPNTVAGTRKEIDALRRMAALGVDPNGTSPAALRALGKFATLHDDPFRSLVTLTKDAGLAAGDVTTIAKSMTDCGSDKAAVDVVARERDDRREQIATRTTTGGHVVLPPAHRVRMILGQILKPEYVASPSLLREPRADRAADYETMLDQAVNLLTTVLRLQRESA